MAELDAGRFMFIFIEFIIGFMAICMNGLVVLTYVRTPTLHTVRNYFILSVALADMLAGTTIPPITILTYLGLPKNFEGCLLVHSLILTFTSISAFNLLALAIDRYIAIKFTNRYNKVLSPCNAIILIVITWIVAILITIVLLRIWHKDIPGQFPICDFVKVIPAEYMVFVFICVVQGFPFVALMVLLIVIYRKIQQDMALTTEMLPFDDQEENRKIKKGVRSITYIFIVLVVCWLPLDVVDIINYIDMNVRPPQGLLNFFIVLSHSRSFVNPYFYVYGDKVLQETIIRAVPLARYIVPRTKVKHNTFADAYKYMSENPVEIVSVVLSSPKLVPRESVVASEMFQIRPIISPRPVMEVESELETTSYGSSDVDTTDTLRGSSQETTDTKGTSDVDSVRDSNAQD